MNKTSRYLNSSTWGRTSLPTRRSHPTLLWLRTMVSGLEVLILISAVSHSAANHSSESWRSPLDGANRTTSSAKSRSEILRPTNWNPSALWLHLEILSINVMNRICDRGQPWQSPNLTENESDRTNLANSHSVCTGLGQSIAMDTVSHTPGVTLQDTQRDKVKYILQTHKTYRLVGQIPMLPPGPQWWSRAGPVFHNRDGTYIVPPESEIQWLIHPCIDREVREELSYSPHLIYVQFWISNKMQLYHWIKYTFSFL